MVFLSPQLFNGFVKVREKSYTGGNNNTLVYTVFRVYLCSKACTYYIVIYETI